MLPSAGVCLYFSLSETTFLQRHSWILTLTSELLSSLSHTYYLVTLSLNLSDESGAALYSELTELKLEHRATFSSPTEPASQSVQLQQKGFYSIQEGKEFDCKWDGIFDFMTVSWKKK